jgi:mono/diheme cytochrome c family protein
MRVKEVAATVAAMMLAPTAAEPFFHADREVGKGRALYAEHCAACHGSALEGAPDWRTPDTEGRYPAPPHDASGHTWHHGDGMLIDYVKRGGQAVLEDMGVDFVSGMPGFGAVLSDDEIAAILAFIRSTWPPEIRAFQAERTAEETGR